MSNEASQKDFEAWAKSVGLDTSMGPSDAWGRKQYEPHIESMWTGWQASRNQAQPDDENSVEYWKSYSKSQDHSYDLLRREVKKLRAANITHALPTPAVMPSELLPKAQWLGDIPGYTHAQMKAYRNAALEEAAQACEALACTACEDSNITRHECAAKIRRLK